MTPVLFLDEASCHSCEVGKAHAQAVAKTLIEVLRSIRRFNSHIALNTHAPIGQQVVAPNWTLQAVLDQEEWMFIQFLRDRSPFCDGVEQYLDDINSRELRTKTNQIASTALAWANLLDSATVSFDAHPDWSGPWVGALLSVLEDDETLSESDCEVRNFSKTDHTALHHEWLERLGLSEAPTGAQVWSEREQRFPSLIFLARVEQDLVGLERSGGPYSQALSALASLSKDAARWPVGQSHPNFSTKATPEYENRRRFCWVHDVQTGQRELFDWHVRFTGGIAGRIHFRVDAQNRRLVVAYLGRKLDREIVAG
jgi:hypothetical protein